MKYLPLGDKVLIQALPSEQNIGGLIIPDTSTNLKKGVILKAGPGKPGNLSVVKEGDEILFRKDDTTPVTIDGSEYLIITESNIWLNAPKT